MLAHLAEIVRLRLGCGDTQLFDVLGSDVDHFIDVLQCSFVQKEASICHQRTVPLVQLRIDDRVGDAGFIFDGKEDEAVGRAGSLSGNHTGGDAGFDPVAKHTEVICTTDTHRP